MSLLLEVSVLEVLVVKRLKGSLGLSVLRHFQVVQIVNIECMR